MSRTRARPSREHDRNRASRVRDRRRRRPDARPLHPLRSRVDDGRSGREEWAVLFPEGLSDLEIEDFAVFARMVKMGVVLGLAGLVLMVGSAPADDAKAEQSSKPLRAGIIGLDTSHVIQFTKLLNARDPTQSWPAFGSRRVFRVVVLMSRIVATAWRASHVTCARNTD